MNVGVILAAGMGSRFDNKIPKQLFQVNGKSMICHSVDALSILDETIIATNLSCFHGIMDLAPTILVNTDSRLKSIKAVIDHLGTRDIDKIVIHDAARPYINQSHIQELLNSPFPYSQYCLKLVNGLVKQNGDRYEVVDRKDYLELCTPLICDYRMFFKFATEHMSDKRCEFIEYAGEQGIPFNLIEGHHKFLRKITTPDDL